MHDVCIVGAGIAGCACARELAAYDLDIVVVDAGYDVCCGATRANSGIVHAGYDPKPGTLKAKYNLLGSLRYEQLSQELGFDYRRNGSLVVAFSDEEVPALEELLERGNANGVEGLRIIDSQELHEREPNLNPDAVAALWVPTGAIMDPYGAALAFAENAAVNGVVFQFEQHVSNVEPVEGGWAVTLSSVVDQTASTIEARIVINAAGIGSGELNNLVSAHKIHLTPRVGEYVLLDQQWGDAFHSTIFQVPTANGKGVLVTPTVEGNTLIGPNAVPRESGEDTYTTTEGIDYIIKHAGKTWTSIPTWDIITNFGGIRSTCLEEPDFHLGEPDDAPGFFNIAGFDSPGLTSAPAVALEFATQIAERLGAAPRENHIATREAPRHFSRMTNDERAAAIAEDPAWGRIICRCECVSEAQIVAAIHSPVPARTTDAIKWRTRAGMGRCQAGFCLPLVAQIIARETGCDAADVRKGRIGSQIAMGHRGCFTDLPTVAFPGAGDEPEQEGGRG